MARAKVASLEENGHTLVFTFHTNPPKALSCNLDELTDEIKDRGMVHGFVQKLRDSFAGVNGDAADGFSNCADTWNTLVGGKWSDRGEGGEPSISLLAEAISRMTGKDLARVDSGIRAWPKEQRAAARTNPQVAAIMAEIQAERKAKAAAASPFESPDFSTL